MGIQGHLEDSLQLLDDISRILIGRQLNAGQLKYHSCMHVV